MSKTMSGNSNRTKSNLKKLIKNLKRYIIIKTGIQKRALIITPCILAVSIIILASFSFDVSYALAVNCNGKTVGYVTSETVYTEAIESLSENLGEYAEECLNDVEVVEQVVPVGTLLDSGDLETAIVENVDTVNEYYGLFKNGELYAVNESKTELEKCLDEYLEANKGKMEEPEFVDEFKIEKGCYSSNKKTASHELYNLRSKDHTKVGGDLIKTITEKIKYSTKYEKSKNYCKGEKVIISNGKNGKKKITEKVFCIDGKEESRTIIASEVIKKPISKKVAVGTGKGKLKLSKPMKSGTYYISSHYGDYRYDGIHHGIDMCADYGTSIYAAAGGKVIESGYSDDGWGYTVLIDHGNGFKTRYAHSSSLEVKVGEEVARGEVIAKVGSTGYSTGNHLHFELYKNGVRVNPADYY